MAERLTDEIAPNRSRAAVPRLDAETERVTRAFLRHLAGRYPVRDAVLFGSRARGTHAADSDADLAVILQGVTGQRSRIAGEMAEIAFDVLLETGILVQALPLWEGEWRHPERFSNPALIGRHPARRPAAVSVTAATYLRKAERALNEARLLLETQASEGACNRAYYAMFDAARAALLAAGHAVEGGTARTHRGLIAAFGRELVLTGRFDAALGRAFNRAHEIRLLADYTAEPPSLEDAARAVAQVDVFVAAVRDGIDGDGPSATGSDRELSTASLVTCQPGIRPATVSPRNIRVVEVDPPSVERGTLQVT